MAYLGSWDINDYLYFYCNTHDPDTGVGTDADSAPTYRIYENETGTALLNGSMAKLDDANTVGFYSEAIQLLAASGFEAGKQYVIYILATVDGDTGTTHHTFQIKAQVNVAAMNDSVITADKIATDALTSDELAGTALSAIADTILKRGVSNVEDAADIHSLAAVILATLESELSGTVWTIRKTGGTTFDTKTVTVDPDANPITGVT